jgi:hypothetical protein
MYLRCSEAPARKSPGAVWDCAGRKGTVPMSLETWELLSYVVTVIGLPLAIGVFLYEQRKERENEDEAVYQLLSDNYQDFLKVALGHPELGLFSSEAAREDTANAREKKLIIFNMLISLFERAYLLLYDEGMTSKQARRWSSWEDYMREWCRRADFREQLPRLLLGEDPEFVDYLQRIAREEMQPATSR